MYGYRWISLDIFGYPGISRWGEVPDGLNEISSDAARWRLMHAFFVTLSGLRANVAWKIKVSGYNYYPHPLGPAQQVRSTWLLLCQEPLGQPHKPYVPERMGGPTA